MVEVLGKGEERKRKNFINTIIHSNTSSTVSLMQSTLEVNTMSQNNISNVYLSSLKHIIELDLQSLKPD